MLLTDIDTAKRQQRRRLAQLPFETKIAILIKMQRLAREMALTAGRPFQGIVWGEEQPDQRRNADQRDVKNPDE